MLLTGILLLIPLAQQIVWICRGLYREQAMVCLVWFAMNAFIAASLAESFYPKKNDSENGKQ